MLGGRRILQRLAELRTASCFSRSDQYRGIIGLRLPPPPTEKDVPVYNLDFKEVGKVKLPDDIFGVEVRKDILHRVVRWQLAKKQQGTHKVKGRSEVRGGGRKPWPQKGSGRSRQGSIRSPQWRGGGIVHGPVPRSHEHSLPKKVRRLGLKSALSAKASENRLLILDTLVAPGSHKTRDFNERLQRFFEPPFKPSALLVDSGKTSEDGGAPHGPGRLLVERSEVVSREIVRRAAANLRWVDVLPSEGLNVYSILRRSHLMLTQDALAALLQRLRTPVFRGPIDRRRWQALVDAQQQKLAA